MEGSRLPFTRTGGVPQIQFMEIHNPWILSSVRHNSNLWLYGRRMNSFGSQRMMQECDMPGSFLFELVQSCASVLVACWWLPNRSGFYEIAPDEQYDGVVQVAPSLVPRAWPQHWKFCNICSFGNRCHETWQQDSSSSWGAKLLAKLCLLLCCHNQA